MKMMRFDIATLFVEMCERVLDESIIGRARRAGKLEVHCHNIRDYTQDKHKRVDDTPYGGGKGMLMQAEPIYQCYQAVCQQLPQKPRVIYLSPKGSVLNQEKVKKLKEYSNLFLLCGHYEGVDQRVLDEIVDEEISIGDYVLTGGELPAMVLMDCVMRYVPGVLSNDASINEESFSKDLLEYPQYTRPSSFRGMDVPDVLLSGHHKNIAEWQREQSLMRTLKNRPDLLERAELSDQDRKILAELENQT